MPATHELRQRLERTARQRFAALKLDDLLNAYADLTCRLENALTPDDRADAALVRALVMDEIEQREPEKFFAWLENGSDDNIESFLTPP